MGVITTGKLYIPGLYDHGIKGEILGPRPPFIQCVTKRSLRRGNRGGFFFMFHHIQ